MKAQPHLIAPSTRKALAEEAMAEERRALLARVNSAETWDLMNHSVVDLPGTRLSVFHFGFVTSACTDQPPFEGYLIPIHSFFQICKRGEYLPSVLVGIGNQLVIPAIKVGDYILTTGQRERIDNLLNESRSAEYFVEKGLEFVVKGDLSVEEIRQAYFEFCEQRGWRPLTPRQFENDLGDLMLKIHSTQKRTDIRRHGSFVRGFKNVKMVAV